MAKKPNLFIVGQPKSGTAALHAFLDEHPAVFMTREKEPKYFGQDFREESDAFHGYAKFFPCRTEVDYLSYYADALGEETYLGESTTQYLYSKVAAREIKNFTPDARIIMMFREPVDMIHSMHAQYYAFAQDVADFKTAIDLEPERKQGREVPALSFCPSLLFYSERVKFAEQVERYMEQFPPEQIKIIIFDDFKADNAAVFRDVCAWLCIDTGFTPDFRSVNVSELPRNETLNKMFFGSRIKSAVRMVLPVNMYVALKPLVKKLVWAQKNRPPMPPELRARLRRKCKPEVEKFSRLIGQDMITRWGYDKDE